MATRKSHHSTSSQFAWATSRFLYTVALLGLTTASQAQIVLDGTMGPKGAIPGPDHFILDSYGQKFGQNLFHSFSDFQLNAGESATFLGPSSIRNILSRVTGGNPSLINGQLNSTIPGANFFFINPAGTVFGPSAQINVGGSFIVTTADALNLGSNGVFNALDPSATVLSSAAPQAFGFLKPTPNPIQFYGTQILGVPGRSVSIVGGDILIGGGSDIASNGGLNVVSVGGSGTVSLNTDDASKPIGIKDFPSLGTIQLDGGSVLRGIDEGGVTVRGQDMLINTAGILLSNNSALPSPGADIQLTADLILVDGGLQTTNVDAPGAPIRIQAGRLLMAEDGVVQSLTTGSGVGGGITIQANEIQMFDGSQIVTTTQGPGTGGAVKVTADTVIAQGKGRVTGLLAITQGDGDGGALTLETGKLVLSKASLLTNSLGAGKGGALTIKADTITLDGGNTDRARIASDSQASGQGGSVNITSRDLQVKSGGVISANALGSGDGGSIVIKADKILVQGEVREGASASTISAGTAGTGHGGSIDITVRSLRVIGQATISTSSYGTGDGGALTITADTILLDGQNSQSTGLGSESYDENSGKGGTVKITSRDVEMRRGGVITTTTRSASRGGDINLTVDELHIDGTGSSKKVVTGFNVASQGQGQGGNLAVNAQDIVIESPENLAGIFANALSAGDGGNVAVNTGSLQLRGAGSINASTRGSGNSGNIDIKARNVSVNGAGALGKWNGGIAAVADLGSTGTGGTINIDTQSLQVIDKATIDASTFGKGNSGSISIIAKDILLDSRGSVGNGIAAASGNLDAPDVKTGNSGNISIKADTFKIKENAGVTTLTFGSGKGGNINIEARDFSIDGAGKVEGINHISTEAAGTSGSNNGGNVTIKADSFRMENGAFVSSTTAGAGNGGTIQVDAKSVNIESRSEVGAVALGLNGDGNGGDIKFNVDGNFVMDGKGELAALTADTFYSGENSAGEKGKGGTVSIKARNVSLRDRAVISTSSSSVENSGDVPTGNGGKIGIEADNVSLDRSVIASQAVGIGNAGDVTFKVKGGLTMSGGAISALSEKSNGGNINIEAGGGLYAYRSQLTAFAQNNGGNVSISTPSGGALGAVILDRAAVRANAINGSGGNILLRSRIFLPSAESIIDASSRFGVAGNVNIDSPNTNVGASLVLLPSNLLGAENYLSERCRVRVTGATSSFTVNPQNGVPTQPGDLLPSPAPR